jgi:hypothetical protein
MKHTKLSIAIASAAIFIGTQFAGAVPTMRLSADSGTTWITVTDGSGSDANSIVGAVTYIGSVGIWSLTVDTGITKPYSGTGVRPDMDINYIVGSSTAGTLIIEWSDDLFGPMPLGSNFLAIASATNQGSSTYTTWLDVNNNIPQVSPTLITSQSFGAGGAGGSASGAGTADPSFSLTQRITVTHTAGGNSSGDAELKVPDGGTTLTLLGGSLLGLGALRRKLVKA